FLRTSLENKSALGLLANKYMQAGEFVPDEIIDAIIEESVNKMDPETSVLFDGFPRTTYQANFLDQVFTNSDKNLDAVIYLDTSDKEIRRRLYGRLICRKCQLPHHIDYIDKMSCEKEGCNGELFRRPDDKSDIPAARLRVYHRETEPLLDFYQKTGKLHIVDAERKVEVVEQELNDIFTQIKNKEWERSGREQPDVINWFHRRTPKVKSVKKRAPALDLIFLGAPGSGKGTQAKFLCSEFGIEHVSTGDLFRSNIEGKSQLGKIARFYIERGELVPNDITEGMVRQRLKKKNTRSGIVLDGFPRTLPQAKALGQMMEDLGRKVAGVIYIDVPDNDIIDRLAGRVNCKKCQTSFHKIFSPFAVCPTGKCKGEHLYQRDDDTLETVKKRLNTFQQQTQPLIDYYQDKNVLHRIIGDVSVEEVKHQITTVVKSLQ
ncbi:MAG: adenylate kinase, partial [Gammaproteobacteria bacterium]|nr:adenylate kinase [Gammaproteobacteria bacterium]